MLQNFSVFLLERGVLKQLTQKNFRSRAHRSASEATLSFPASYYHFELIGPKIIVMLKGIICSSPSELSKIANYLDKKSPEKEVDQTTDVTDELDGWYEPSVISSSLRQNEEQESDSPKRFIPDADDLNLSAITNSPTNEPDEELQNILLHSKEQPDIPIHTPKKAAKGFSMKLTNKPGPSKNESQDDSDITDISGDEEIRENFEKSKSEQTLPEPTEADQHMIAMDQAAAKGFAKAKRDKKLPKTHNTRRSSTRLSNSFDNSSTRPIKRKKPDKEPSETSEDKSLIIDEGNWFDQIKLSHYFSRRPYQI
jgi:hypothetical protein